MILQWY